MNHNRIQSSIYKELASALPAAPQGFVPCPVALLSTLTPVQQIIIAEVYQMARERAEARRQTVAAPWLSRLLFSEN